MIFTICATHSDLRRVFIHRCCTKAAKAGDRIGPERFGIDTHPFLAESCGQLIGVQPRTLQCFQLEFIVKKTDLSTIYRHYIACLNKQDWPQLGQFVDDEADYNGKRIGLSGYREMLEKDFTDIPDLHFNIELLISDPPYIASRLSFACTPKGVFLGLQVNGKKVFFTENVFYQFREGKIAQVWSVIDKVALEAQLE